MKRWVMSVKLVCAVLAMSAGAAAGDELLEALAGAHGGNRLVVCAQGARCPAVLWRREWALARASCLHGRTGLRVHRDYHELNCAEIENGKLWYLTGRVRYRFTHPHFCPGSASPSEDAALLALERGYVGDSLVNATSAKRLLAPFEPWMEETYTDNPLHAHGIPHSHTSTLFATPLRMFMTTVLLPSLLFMVFFVYVIFYTGPKEPIPYVILDHDKEKQSEDADNYEDKTKDEDYVIEEHDRCAFVEEADQYDDYECVNPWGVKNPWGI